ncbi:MAG TPA: hypothetical protein VFR86_26775 [Burkholderiaceae bacterium]|nr:hypothetical protein [Burkholderiaceae bacterium]
MKVRTFFVGACLTAAALPAFLVSLAAQSATPGRAGAAASATPVTWPTHFRGRPLTQLPLSALEARFAARFPGALARFAFDGAEGRQTLIVRHVTQPTRQLHPAVDCFRAAGYAVGQDAPKIDRVGARWRCFIASRDHHDVRVCERIAPASATSAAEWTDVSAWYWHALWHGGGPWRALTLVTPL